MMQYHEVAKICDGLAHPIRAKVYEILLEKGEIKASDLFKIIQEEFNISSRQTLFTHLSVMEKSGLIEIYKKKRNAYVRLKLIVDINTKPCEMTT